MLPIPSNVRSTRHIVNEKMSPTELKAFMDKHGMSDKELGEVLGITGPAIRWWLLGKREISVTNSRLLRFFDKHPKMIAEF